MSKARTLAIRPQFDSTTQHSVGLTCAMLDDQLANLKIDVADMTVEQLEWQPAPGLNTVGMLLCHIAVAEAYWMNVPVHGMRPEPEGVEVIRRIIGIHGDDDGLPLPPDGKHPATLSGKSLDDYFRLIDLAREATAGELRAWDDKKLNQTFVHPVSGVAVSFGWVLYHVLEHFSGHYGQILLLSHQMRSAGLLAVKAES